MKDNQAPTQVIKHEKYRTIDSKLVRPQSHLLNEAYKKSTAEKEIILEPDYKKESCNYDSSRVYSETLYLSNFRC